MKNVILIILIAACISVFQACSDEQNNGALHIISKTEVGQIEVGGPYAGIEIHNSYPMLNRISFYYPVANSIDISEDYWKRENYRIMSVGLKVGDAAKSLLEKEIYEVDQTPYSVSFYKQKDETGIEIKYEFCKDKPAMVVTYNISNLSNSELDYELYTRLETVLRTSHTYKLIDNAVSSSNNKNNSISFDFNNIEAGNTQISIINAGHLPESFTTKSLTGTESKSLDNWWLDNEAQLSNELIQADEKVRPAAAFIYKKTLQPGENLEIVQIVASSNINEGEENADYLSHNYLLEIAAYENYILNESSSKKALVTGDKNIDFTAEWAKAVMVANAHYLDNEIVPMPAQAEYNFYFTHDALLTDLAAVNFDLPRVKQDLQFIISHADMENVIPHAYYWKDTTYRTEYAGTENWNHFWFTLLSARYLRHSGDIEFLKKLYPFIEKSINTALKNKGEDGLMWSYRPDWWDIGNNFGPRAYMTILAVRALREFNYIAASLNKENALLIKTQNLANVLNENLVDKLWDEKLSYLISYYEDGTKDEHIYMGSLLASHFDLLDYDKNYKLMETAKKYLLDDKLGIYTIFPMDLHELIDYMKFSGNEAGEPYHYGNGGIWPHGNAWYALGLMKNGMRDEAYNFIKTTMTLDGIGNSPNGQPAMYEYRISDKSNPKIYGKIDKPQFLWAAGWYFYSLYHLFGIIENEWNISIDPYLPENIKNINLSLTINGNLVPVNINGEGNNISSINYNGREIPSAVIPADIEALETITVELGKQKTPYLTGANTKVYSPDYDRDNKSLSFTLESFKDHKVKFMLVSPDEVESITQNNTPVSKYDVIIENENYKIKAETVSETGKDNYKINFR